MRTTTWVVLAAALALPASGQTPTFTLVVDTTMQIPGWGTNFSGLSVPALCGQKVAFSGGVSTHMGIYTNVGGTLRVVADTTTPAPSGRIFSNLGKPALFGSDVIFMAYGATTAARAGVYAWSGGAITVVADPDTRMGSLTCNYATDPSISGRDIVFQASWLPGGPTGIYGRIGGALQTVIDNSSSLWSDIGRPTISGENVAFRAYSLPGPIWGIWVARRGLVGTIADTRTPIPGGTGNFTSFTDTWPSISGDHVAFRGAGSNFQEGIYATIGGLTRIADRNTPIPGGTGNFVGLYSPSISGSTVAFRSNNDIWAWLNGSLRRVVAYGTLIGGRYVNNADILHHSVSGNRIAFRAVHQDGTAGIYIASFYPLIETTDRAAVGGTVNLSLEAPADAGNLYVAAASFGIRPGIPVDTRLIPLNPDPVFFLSLQGAGVFDRFFGVLDGTGHATAAVHLPADPNLAGIALYVAYVTIRSGAPSGIGDISNAVALPIVP